MISCKVTIKTDTFSEPRDCYEFIEFIKSLQNCEVEIEDENGKKVKGSSIIKFLTLKLWRNSVLTIYCNGENEEENLKKIEELFNEINGL